MPASPNHFPLVVVSWGAADCPSGLGVAAIEWRRGATAEKENTARIGGFRVHCNSE
jgi:hypothetical protein